MKKDYKQNPKAIFNISYKKLKNQFIYEVEFLRGEKLYIYELKQDNELYHKKRLSKNKAIIQVEPTNTTIYINGECNENEKIFYLMHEMAHYYTDSPMHDSMFYLQLENLMDPWILNPIIINLHNNRKNKHI